MGGVTLPFANSEQALHLKNVIMWRYYQPSDSPRKREKSSQKNFQQLATPFADLYTLELCLTNEIEGFSFFNTGSVGLLLPHIILQGGRTWQPFVGSKNGNENFCQARIYKFCVKCVIFARNRKFAKLTQ